MSREIKFRFWDNEEKEYWKMVGNGCPTCGSKNYHLDDKEGYITEQYIGLKDKNGAEVYEGDIILSCTKSKWQVLFKDGGFCYAKVDLFKHIDYVFFGGHSYPETILDCEVIGNIRQNPELLEVKEC
jgi:hypothetical protein